MGRPNDWRVMHRALAAVLGAGGLDLVHPFSRRWLDAAGLDLADPGSLQNQLGILVGNSRRLWDVLVRAVAQSPDLGVDEHPLQRYVERTLQRALGAQAVAHRVYYSHTLGDQVIPIQRIAEAVGLARLSPSHLCIHPRFGPWVALRAVLLFEIEGPSGPPPTVQDHCGGCRAPCVPALENARAAQQVAAPDAWKKWLAVRDACPVGTDARYSEAQIEYHYRKDRRLIGGARP